LIGAAAEPPKSGYMEAGLIEDANTDGYQQF
jgi:hypothetical protein